MFESVLIAGSGGQGILFTGRILAQAGLDDGKEVTFFPSYGAEIRGGTAHCVVIISDTEIGSPVVWCPSSMIIMNNQSLSRFLPRFNGNAGTLVLDTSMITGTLPPGDVRKIGVPATDMAVKELDDKKVANMILVGAYIKSTRMVSPGSVKNAIRQQLAKKGPAIIERNQAAFEKGMESTHEH